MMALSMFCGQRSLIKSEGARQRALILAVAEAGAAYFSVTVTAAEERKKNKFKEKSRSDKEKLLLIKLLTLQGFQIVLADSCLVEQ